VSVALTVTVLGSSGMFATVERACAGYLIEVDDYKLWLDAGAGSWRNLLSHIDYRDLDGILLSHRHPDHTSDVLQAFHARHYGDDGPLEPIPLWAPAEAVEIVSNYSSESRSGLDFHTITEESALEIGNARFSFVRMAHPVETLGVRIEYGDTVFAYSSDTGEDADFKTLAESADLFLCEATLQDSDDMWTGHLRATQAARIATLADARLLVLTHLPPGRDHQRSLAEARAETGTQVMLAADGLRLEVEG
jgi:ribonuclease BN (tRNA processing enzyme)